MSKLIEPSGSTIDVIINIDDENDHYHKIIGSSIFGFNDFSILHINGKYSKYLKGNYETFSQFINSIPINILEEKFIIWEGVIYETEDENANSKSFLYDGNLRKISINEITKILNVDSEHLNS